jgi:hypothetical protein
VYQGILSLSKKPDPLTASLWSNEGLNTLSVCFPLCSAKGMPKRSWKSLFSVKKSSGDQFLRETMLLKASFLGGFSSWG